MTSTLKAFLFCFIISCFSSAQIDSKTTLTICWDTSYSMKDRVLDLEISLLDSLIGTKQWKHVRLLKFANDVQEKNFNITNGDWSSLKNELQNVSYDGATIFENLNLISRKGKTLVFTEGDKIFDDDFLSLDKEDILINSSPKVNLKTLQLWEFLNRAILIDLKKNSLNEKNSDEAPSIKGSVYVDGKPAPNVLIHSSSGQSFISDGAGRFQYEGSIGDTLRIKGTQNSHNDLIVNDYESEINFFLNSKTVVLDEVTVRADALEELDMVSMGYASIERKKVGFAVYDISEEDISEGETNISGVLAEVPGLIMGRIDYSGTTDGNLARARIRGKTSINYDAYALVVIDGTPIQRTVNTAGIGNANYNVINPHNIKSIQVLRGLAATNLYGSEGRGGVILITSKTGSRNEAAERPIDQARLTDNIFEGKLIRKKGQLNTRYLQELKKSKNLKDAYEVYLEQRKDYLNNFWYFIDVSDYFRTANKQLADKVLSNILERSFGYEAIRTLFLKYSEIGEHEMALKVAKQMIKDYPKKIQSYLDRATAYKNLGNFQSAVEQLNRIVMEDLETKMNFSHLSKVASAEMRNLINQHKQKLDLSNINANYLNNLTYNARLRFDWASPQDEFILKFVNPQNRFFDWEHTSIQDKKRITNEIQHGFGTEQFEIVGDMSKGKWGIYVTNLTGPSMKDPFLIKCTIDYNFGKPNQYSEEKLIRLDSSENQEQLFFEFSIF
jgi:tetratricopeptide (TPR) repeat protein